MEKYRETFPNENIYIHNPTTEKPGTFDPNPKKYRYKYIYIWRALTPTGKISKYFHAELSNTWRHDNFYPLPKLKKGYQWAGPFLYGIYDTWEA